MRRAIRRLARPYASLRTGTVKQPEPIHRLPLHVRMPEIKTELLFMIALEGAGLDARRDAYGRRRTLAWGASSARLKMKDRVLDGGVELPLLRRRRRARSSMCSRCAARSRRWASPPRSPTASPRHRQAWFDKSMRSAPLQPSEVRPGRRRRVLLFQHPLRSRSACSTWTSIIPLRLALTDIYEAVAPRGIIVVDDCEPIYHVCQGLLEAYDEFVA